MLYIWPYFMFFSWPIIIAPLAASLLASLSSKRGLHRLLNLLPRPFVAASFIALMLLAVHFNTIVHPFTLADNRHYVFYVFRILMRRPFIKYAATPVYFLCGWAAISTLGGTFPEVAQVQTKLASRPQQKIRSRDVTNVIEDPLDCSRLSTNQTRVSFALVWLASTTLCLVTAPLVEPRYFIIPWVLWRLHIPPSMLSLNRNGVDYTRCQQSFRHLPLILEGLWYIAINAVTGYMFLYQGFEWPQEPGRIQRFMW